MFGEIFFTGMIFLGIIKRMMCFERHIGKGIIRQMGRAILGKWDGRVV